MKRMKEWVLGHMDFVSVQNVVIRNHMKQGYLAEKKDVRLVV